MGANVSSSSQESVNNITNDLISNMASSVENSSTTDVSSFQNINIVIRAGRDVSGNFIRATNDTTQDVSAKMAALSEISNEQSSTIANEISNKLDAAIEQANEILGVGANVAATDQSIRNTISNSIQQSITNNVRNVMRTEVESGQNIEINIEAGRDVTDNTIEAANGYIGKVISDRFQILY